MDLDGLLRRFRELKKRQEQQEIATEGVYDPVLIRLRNDRIKQIQEQEKRSLREVVREHNKMKTRTELFGMVSEPKKNGLFAKHNIKKGLLNDSRPLLKEKYCFKNNRKLLK